MRRNAGLTLTEMMIVIMIIGVVSMGAVPIAEMSFIRLKESELQDNLQKLRNAISQWRRDCEAAVIRQQGQETMLTIPDCNLYPPGITALAQAKTFPVLNASSEHVATFYSHPYIDKVDIDPFIGNPTWLEWYASGTIVSVISQGIVEQAGGIGVYDVSPATDTARRRGFDTALDGTKYKDW